MGDNVDMQLKLHEKEVYCSYTNLVQKYAQTPEMLLGNFPVAVRTQEFTRLCVFQEVCSRIVPVTGVVIEVGVENGFSLFTMAHFLEVYEPRNYTRRLYGFDTFTGYAALDPIKDGEKRSFKDLCKTFSFELLSQAVSIFNDSVWMNQFEKIKLVRGDVIDSAPQFVKEHPEGLIALLYLSTSTYMPTLASLRSFWDRIPLGGIVLFSALADDKHPGETAALEEFCRERSMALPKINRFSYATKYAYIVKSSA